MLNFALAVFSTRMATGWRRICSASHPSIRLLLPSEFLPHHTVFRTDDDDGRVCIGKRQKLIIGDRSRPPNNMSWKVINNFPRLILHQQQYHQSVALLWTLFILNLFCLCCVSSMKVLLLLVQQCLFNHLLHLHLTCKYTWQPPAPPPVTSDLVYDCTEHIMTVKYVQQHWELNLWFLVYCRKVQVPINNDGNNNQQVKSEGVCCKPQGLSRVRCDWPKEEEFGICGV